MNEMVKIELSGAHIKPMYSSPANVARAFTVPSCAMIVRPEALPATVH